MRLSLLLGGVLVVAGCWVFSAAAVSEDDSSQPTVPKYESKIAVETPAEMAIEKFIESSPRTLPKAESKIAVETPAEKAVEMFREPSRLKLASIEPSPTTDRQPTAAQPGKVDWRVDFETACRASRDSGKPVLLFQLMGRLDEVFC